MKSQKLQLALTSLCFTKKNSKSDNKSKQKNTNLDIYIHKMFHLWFSINNSNNSRYTTSF